MCGASASTPEGMMILAVQKLYYNINPSKFVGIFLILSTQMLGYGVAGVLRHTLVYPCKMIFPINLPIASIMETLHRDSTFIVKKKMKVFYISFITLLLWQSFPQYISKF
jgi:OPT oligopeptide transporter protein